MKKMNSYVVGLSAFFMSSLPLFAQDGEAAPAAKEGGFMQTLIMIGIALVFFYFILWRPEQKRRKAMEQQRNSLKAGDRVTAMGIIGHIVKVQETSVILKMYDGAKIEVLKAAITDVQPSSVEAEKPASVETR